MLKKILTVSLCFVLLLSVTSCGLNIEETIFGSAETEENITKSSAFPTSPSVTLPEAPKTDHTPISRENYYQYSLLNDTDKELYNKICSSIEAQQNFVDIKKYNLTPDGVQDIYNKIVADNPQYFWLSKFMEYSYYTKGDKTTITHIILAYTDGQITDEFDDDNNFISTADREKIKKQKIEFDNKSTAFLNSVLTDISEIEKERLIHDYIMKTVTYDDANKDKKLTRKNYMRIYDVYGALINGSAVCEGYARLFQYLCYQVGINSASVYGTSGENHAWNVVKIGGEWYHVDTTWDDGSTDGIPLYKYFNLTEKQITATHEIDRDIFSVPNATATKYSFKNTYGINISRNSPPQNYEKAIDYFLKYNEKYLALVCDGELPNSIYINRYCFKLNSDIQKYIKACGYKINFEQSYYIADNFIFLIKK